MRRNEIFTTTAVANTENVTSVIAEEKKTVPNEKAELLPEIVIPAECQTEFIKAMKIGYYKEFYKQGLITSEQLEQLIAMQDNNTLEAAA